MGLMVEASRKDQETVGVLSLPEYSALQVGCLDTVWNADSWSTSAANSRSELVIVMCGLSSLTRLAVISAGHFNLQT